jgi:hypothetical protein
MQQQAKYSICPKAGTKEMYTMIDCAAICEATAIQCAIDGNKKIAKLCIECADVCKLAWKCACAESEHAKQMMEICSQICMKCAAECEKNHSIACQECAEICKMAAKSSTTCCEKTTAAK